MSSTESAFETVKLDYCKTRDSLILGIPDRLGLSLVRAGLMGVDLGRTEVRVYDCSWKSVLSTARASAVGAALAEPNSYKGLVPISILAGGYMKVGYSGGNGGLVIWAGDSGVEDDRPYLVDRPEGCTAMDLPVYYLI